MITPNFFQDVLEYSICLYRVSSYTGIFKVCPGDHLLLSPLKHFLNVDSRVRLQASDSEALKLSCQNGAIFTCTQVLESLM